MVTPPTGRMHGMRLWLWLWLCCLALPRPGDAIVCYHCDSIVLPECAQTLGEVGVLPFKECTTELTCVMSIVDSITYRGCGAETPTTQATYSKRCSTNLCNSGVYPPGRLKCHHCAGESCVSAPAGKPHPCRHHHEVDQCYTEIVSATEGYRGCRSDSNHTATENAQLCEINGCNDALGAWTLSCAQCDSRVARGCKMDLFQLGSRCNVSQFEQCQQQLLLGQEQDQFCYTYHKLGRVVRGCSAQLLAELEPHRDELVKCASGDYCNAVCLAQQTCLSCSSAERETCRSNATALTSSVCGSAEASSCYACEYDDLQVLRGCGTPPADAGINSCYECQSNGKEACNTLDFTRCYRCSSDDAAGCGNWERPGGIYIEQCNVPASPCLVINYINGTTERGCQTVDLNCNITSVASCRSCDGSFCNKGAYPEQRLWCHQCTNCDQVRRGQDALPCGVLANEPHDQPAACLEYHDAESGQVVRGCRSNAQLYYECMLRSAGQSGCRLCRTHGCNDTPGQQLRGALQIEELEGKAEEHLEHYPTALRSGSTNIQSTIITSTLTWFSIIYHIISLN